VISGLEMVEVVEVDMLLVIHRQEVVEQVELMAQMVAMDIQLDLLRIIDQKEVMHIMIVS